MLTPKFRWDVKNQTNKTNTCNRMLQAYVTVARWLTCFKNKTCNVLGFMEIIVYKIQPVGGWGYTISIPGPNGCSIKLNRNLLHMRIKSSLKTHARPSSETRRLNFSKQESLNQERSGSAVECLTRDRGATGPSFTCVTVLCP